jgi:hypothetical protein
MDRAYLCGVLFPLLGDDVLPQQVIVGDRVPRTTDLHQAVEIRQRRRSCVRGGVSCTVDALRRSAARRKLKISRITS